MEKIMTDLMQRAVEIAAKYKMLSLQDKINIIAQAFNCKTGTIKTSPCTGKWRGTSDIFIVFDSGLSLEIGNTLTPKAKTKKVQDDYINAELVRYNPEIIAETKQAAFETLKKQETEDNKIALQKGLKPYTLLAIEFSNDNYHAGWYYVTIAIEGKIYSHLDTGLNYAIMNGEGVETLAAKNYFVAGGLKETDVDYVFHNVGFSSAVNMYKATISADAMTRAKKHFIYN